MNHVFVAGLQLADRIFSLTDTLSCHLQSITMNGADGREVAIAAVKHFKDWKTEEEFDFFSGDIRK